MTTITMPTTNDAAAYLRQHARETLALADEVDALGPDAVIVEWGMSTRTDEVFLYSRVENGVDQGQCIQNINATREPLPMERMFAPLHVGESVAYDYQWDRKSPVSHCVDTLLGRYRIVAHLPERDGYRVSVGVPVPHNAA